MEKNVKVDLSCEIANIKFKNPLFLSEGPLSGSAKLIERAAGFAVGGIVTKSMREGSFASPSMHMIKSQRGLINADWSDIGFENWLKELKKLSIDIPLITNVATNHVSPKDAAKFAEILQHHGASMVTFSDYIPENLIDAVKYARDTVDVPIMVKLPPFQKNIGPLCARLEEAGVNCIAAMDAVGPAMDIDITTGRTMLGSEDGSGYMSSEPIFPLALAYIAEICRYVSVPVVGVGGITTYKDVVKMIMAGATAVGIVGGAILNGLQIFDKIERDLKVWMSANGYETLDQFRATIHKQEILGDGWEIIPALEPALCNGCAICEKVCFKQAITMVDKKPVFDYSECVRCGVCITSCPKDAILQKRSAL